MGPYTVSGLEQGLRCKFHADEKKKSTKVSYVRLHLLMTKV